MYIPVYTPGSPPIQVKLILSFCINLLGCTLYMYFMK